MRYIALQLFFIILSFGLNQSTGFAQLSSKLVHEVERTEVFYAQRKVYDAEKVLRINRLKGEVLNSSGDNTKLYALYEQLYHEYFSFKSYEAYHAAIAMEKLAQQINVRDLQIEIALYKAEILLCSGLFNEAIQLLDRIKHWPKGDFQVDYYRIMTRLYGDLKTYNDIPGFKQHYEALNHTYTDSLLKHVDEHSVEFQMVTALKLIDQDDAEQALLQCQHFLNEDGVSDHQKAMVYSCMAWGAAKINDSEAQIRYLLRSIEADIRSSTYETTSGRVLAQLLLANGEIELAHQFALRAIEDAEFYGARQRKAEITHLVPIIEKQLKELQQFKMKAIAGISLFIMLSLIVIIYLWVRLMKRHKEVKAGHEKINEQNALLKVQNEQLSESNKIKEEYLTNYFELSSVYFHEMEKMQEKIRSLLVQKKYSAIADYIDVSGPKEDKDRLFERFDELFLNLFPTFLPAINKVLSESVEPHEDQVRLTSELRVFALNRLGITSTDRITSILGVSRNTVYTYRNRIKTKSKLSPDEFDAFIMNIPAF